MNNSNFDFAICVFHRWRRGHKARNQGQGQPFRGQTLSRPRTGILEAKNQGHKRKCSPKKRFSKNFFKRFPKKTSKKVFKKIFAGDLQLRNTQKPFANFLRAFWRFSTKLHWLKNSAVLEPRTAQFSRLEDLRPRTWLSRPRTSKCILEAKNVLEDSTSGIFAKNKILHTWLRVCRTATSWQPVSIQLRIWSAITALYYGRLLIFETCLHNFYTCYCFGFHCYWWWT